MSQPVIAAFGANQGAVVYINPPRNVSEKERVRLQFVVLDPISEAPLPVARWLQFRLPMLHLEVLQCGTGVRPPLTIEFRKRTAAPFQVGAVYVPANQSDVHGRARRILD